MKKIANPLEPGDVILTHPARGFWGCAVVLTAIDSTEQFHPMCHIAITTFISKHRFTWASVDQSNLEIVRLTSDVRVGPDEWVRDPDERTCIGIYSLKSAKGLSVIARIDPLSIYACPLTFDVGDGTEDRFPLCGPMLEDLGEEAVVAWRQVHDAARLEREAMANRKAFERFERQRLLKAREARQSRAAVNHLFKPKPLRGSG